MRALLGDVWNSWVDFRVAEIGRVSDHPHHTVAMENTLLQALCHPTTESFGRLVVPWYPGFTEG